MPQIRRGLCGSQSTELALLPGTVGRDQRPWRQIQRHADYRVAEGNEWHCRHKEGVSCLRKDPSRYRPASEALIRRMLQGKQLYQRDTLVDLVNLASIAFGYSIGGFDADKFEGDTLTLGVGKAGEPYEGIGRGNINIEGLPVYRDSLGGVGTPTSDNERTKMMSDTSHLVVLINGYDGNEQQVRANAEYIQSLLKNTVRAMEVLISYISNGNFRK